MTTPLTFTAIPQGSTLGWDVPLKADITAIRNKADSAGLTVVASPVYFAGIDPTGATSSTTGLQNSLNAVADGGTWEVPKGTYLTSGLSVTGKTINLRVSQASFVQATSSTILTIAGAFDAAIVVSAFASATINSGTITVTQLTLASAPGWVAGDIVRIFSDDLIPEARPGTGGDEKRKGEFAVVVSSSSTTVLLSGVLTDLPYASAPKVARLQKKTATVDHWVSQTSDAGMATFTSGQLTLDTLINPVVNGVTIAQGGGSGITFDSCYGYGLNNANIRNLKDDTGNGQFGYAISDKSSENGVIIAPVISNVRHGFTDDTAWSQVGDTDAGNHGRSRNAKIIGGQVFGNQAAGWDTHAAGEGHSFVNCTSSGCQTGQAFRGKNHRSYNAVVTNCQFGITVFVETDHAGTPYTRGVEIHNPSVTGCGTGLTITNFVYTAGALVATVVGGHVDGTVMGATILKSDVVLRGGLTINGVGATLSNTVQIETGVVTVDNIAIDLTGLGSSGSTIRAVRLIDAASTIRGRRVDIRATGTAARMTSEFLGTSGDSGTVDLQDVVQDIVWTTALLTFCSTTSKITYRVTGTGKTSAQNDATAIAAGYLIPVTSDDVALYQTLSSTVDRTLGALGAGKYQGQRMVLFNAGGFLITVPHGGAFLTSLAGAADYVLAIGKSLTLVWNGTLWVGLAEQQSVPAIEGFDFLSSFGTNPMVSGLANTTTIAPSVANDVIIMPIKPRRNVTVAVLTWIVGGTASGNYDIGIYTLAGTKLWSKGSTAWPTASSTVNETVSPTVALVAGTTYWLAIAGDNTSGTFRGALTVGAGQMQMLDGTTFTRRVASSFPLPSSLTPGTTAASRQPLIVVREA